jgi:hypothetical protein
MEELVMSVFWMGLAIFSVILISFIFILGITKGIAFVAGSKKKDSVPSHWIVRQVYSGDDSLGHPDLKKMAELQDNELVEGAENI